LSGVKAEVTMGYSLWWKWRLLNRLTERAWRRKASNSVSGSTS